MDLGDRMKLYEKVSQINLTRRMPCIIRIDGKAFHTFTSGMNKPWDIRLVNLFLESIIFLCENIQGLKIAYWQSDEVSLLLTDYEKITTDAWFDKNVQKMVSVSASLITAKFNRLLFRDLFFTEERYCIPVMFDSRVFTLPKEEVCNYFIWRQQDAERNSIQGLAQANFPHKQLLNLSCDKLQDKLFLEKGISWNNCATWQKRGACVVKEYYEKDGATRSKWIVDWEIPIFTKDREYIERYI